MQAVKGGLHPVAELHGAQRVEAHVHQGHREVVKVRVTQDVAEHIDDRAVHQLLEMTFFATMYGNVYAFTTFITIDLIRYNSTYIYMHILYSRYIVYISSQYIYHFICVISNTCLCIYVHTGSELTNCSLGTPPAIFTPDAFLWCWKLSKKQGTRGCAAKKEAQFSLATPTKPTGCERIAAIAS